MKTIEELEEFYYENLSSILEDLESYRKNLKNRLIKYAVAYIVVIFFISFFIIRISENPVFLLFFIFVSFVVASVAYQKFTKEYKNNFKEKIIRPLVKEIDENLNYFPSKYIKESDFNKSRLFVKPDIVGGSDYMVSADIEFSDFYAQVKEKDERNKDIYTTVFKGLFIISKFNKNLKHTTIVLPDTAQNIFGDYIGSLLQKYNHSIDMELVKLDNPDFEKEFVVYSSDQIEARYILTHRFMQNLLNFKNSVGHPIYFSFVGENIYIAIEYNKNLFEASLFHSLLKYNIAMDYLKTLYNATSIINELRLNEKLWSKM